MKNKLLKRINRKIINNGYTHVRKEDLVELLTDIVEWVEETKQQSMSFKMVYEQDLPELTDEQYDLLYKSSMVVFGVRMFPVIVEGVK